MLEFIAELLLSQYAVAACAIILLFLFIGVIIAVIRYERKANHAIDVAHEWIQEMKELTVKCKMGRG